MNIKLAKEQIENAMKAYFSKDEFGNYVIPIEKQRPVFLMGPPGIGKTAIMEQIAAELGVSLVAYSMTHHTRQSAIGLPFITTKNYGGTDYSVSEYTMSEIIASVYDMIEKTGNPEGILFLDEVNCVSETLAPAMLQFLQYKVFGRHQVPEGWIVVAAGNPPEYNNSVREFDIVTWDRLKRVDIEPDFECWKEYAYKKGIHAAIITYLEIKKGDFYLIETTVDGKSFVTARGWSDLSDMIKLYEKNGIRVDRDLIGQYLQNTKIAKTFALYYDLFIKYKSDYQVDDILAGKADAKIKERARKAKFDERYALLGLLLDKLGEGMKEACVVSDYLTELMKALKQLKVGIATTDIADFLKGKIADCTHKINVGKKASDLSPETELQYRMMIRELEKMLKFAKENAHSDSKQIFAGLNAEFKKEVAALDAAAKQTGEHLTNAFKFCEEVFGDGQEILILVTELTISYFGAKFISRFGCEEYFKHNKQLLFYERQKEIISEIEQFEL